MNKYNGSLLSIKIVLLALLPWGVILLSAWGTEEPSKATGQGAPPFFNQMRQSCGECHLGVKPKGGFSLDALNSGYASGNKKAWLKVKEQLAMGSMPPKGKPSQVDKKGLIAWIDQQTTGGGKQGRTVLRRLNRIEYQNTLRDLLGIEIDLQDLLPQDSAAGGFDNIGEALHTSSFLMERYLEAADKALTLAIANGPRPPIIKKRYSLSETHQVKSTTEKVFRKSPEQVVCFSSSAWQAIGLSPFYPPDRGQYRFKISASAFQSETPVTFRVDAGLMLMTGKTHLVSYFDAPVGKERVVEFTDFLEPRNTIRLLPYGLASAQAVNKIGADTYDGPGLAIQWIDVEGPLHEQWPPASHARLLGDLPQAPLGPKGNRNYLETVSQNPEADTIKLLAPFARRAFRRPVTNEELNHFAALAKKKREEGASFEQGLRAAFKAVLLSPDFLFLQEATGPLNDHALASRLSYFLWSAMPDDELFRLADKGELTKPEELSKQVKRMLGDPKAEMFVKNFTGQWLGLREIDATVPSHIFYPEYDEMLKASMLEETWRFFAEVLLKDMSVTNFADSSFTFLNGRLAKHYGIGGVQGWEFKKVNLPPGSHRGGLLTMASVLKVTANGTYTSPVLRGNWVLDRILGIVLPPPPEGVSALEPDIRGAISIRDQLARHRELESCAQCHVKIDPPGFALESYDAIGGWREFYRTSGRGKPVMVEGKRAIYLQGPSVDAKDVFNGEKFNDMEEFKKLLLKEKEQIARGMASRLLTYATGAVVSSADKVAIEKILENSKKADYGFQTMLIQVVLSERFRNN